MRTAKNPINAAALSKKYKCDVGKLIRWWKMERNDFEIAGKLGIDTLKLLQIRQEITHLCEKERLARKNKKLPYN